MEHQEIIDHMKNNGVKASPRGAPVFELLNQKYEFPIGTLLHREGFNPVIGIMEGLGVITGTSVKPQLMDIAPKTYKAGYFDTKTDYGTRAGTHWMDAVNALLDDKESRSAQFTIAKNTDRPNDKPCTLAVQAQIRNNTFHLTAFMRSLDVVRGLAVDVQIWNILAEAMNAELRKSLMCRLNMGTLTIFAANAHLYYIDYEKNAYQNGTMDWNCLLAPTKEAKNELKYDNRKHDLKEWNDRGMGEPVYMGEGFVLEGDPK